MTLAVAADRREDVTRLVLGPSRRVPVLDAATMEALGRAIGRAEGSTAVVIEGGRSGVFAAGADLKELASLTPLEARRLSRRGQDLFDAIAGFPGIVIAAVGGRCLGGAFDLAMACDLRVADRDARFEHPGPRLGFVTGYGGSARLPRLIGFPARGVMSGLTVLDAASAFDLGLVTRVVARREDLPAEAMALARRIARHREGALLWKRLLGAVASSSRPRRAERLLARLLDAEDAWTC